MCTRSRVAPLALALVCELPLLRSSRRPRFATFDVEWIALGPLCVALSAVAPLFVLIGVHALRGGVDGTLWSA